MAYDKFLIAPFETGLQTSLKPWLIPDDAFAYLQNAYVFRGRLRKRFGSTLMGSGMSQLTSRLAINLGTIMTNTLSGTVPGVIFKEGQAFAVSGIILTVSATGTPTTLLSSQPVAAAGTLPPGSPTADGTYDTTTGAFVINTTNVMDGTSVFFYPSEPVMGLTLYDKGAVNDFPAYGFDTQFAYRFSGAAWVRSVTAGGYPIWNAPTLPSLNFFWATNWQGLTDNTIRMFVTNNQVTNYNGAGVATDDPIWYDPDDTGANWAPYSYSPLVNNTGANIFTYIRNDSKTLVQPFIMTAAIILPFKDRLIMLNTVENSGWNSMQTYTNSTNSNFINRCRYSHNGSPFATGNAFLEPNQTITIAMTNYTGDGGGYIDATTEEAIISAEFIKDRLIVYFERSTWELAYTGNELQPFIWQKINTELGSESQFSTVPFDKEILTIGATGVHSCNGANVERIDNKIPDEIFEIIDKKAGVERVAGIRDYFSETVYWTFPITTQDPSSVFPTEILVYNYRNNTWAINTDCVTAWGYCEQEQGLSWQELNVQWKDANFSWNTGLEQAQARKVIFGNQQGFVFNCQSGDDTVARNAPSMQISNIANGTFNLQTGIILDIIDHTLQDGEYIKLEGALGIDGGGNIVPLFSNLIVQVQIYTSGTASDQIFINQLQLPAGVTYIGAGTVARVSNYYIQTKQWNPYDKIDRNVYLAKIDFLVSRTEPDPDTGIGGQITVDYAPSSSNISMLKDAANINALTGTGILETTPYDPTYYPLEQSQDRLWHPVYFQGSGTCIQLTMYLSDAQIISPLIAEADLEIHGMILNCQKTDQRLQ